MKLSEFQYELPEGRIAEYPAVPRDASRLLVLPQTGDPLHTRFRRLPDLLRAGDLLVLNDTRVIKARLLGTRAGGGAAEVFLLRPHPEGLWEALVRPGKKLPPGVRVALGHGAFAEIVERLDEGRRLVRLSGGEVGAILRRSGHIPLPPYIRRGDEPSDARRYQTVFAREGHSVAAPTAGLHFTPRVFAALARAGVGVCRLRLDVGPGTFKPVTAQEVREHRMDYEPYRIAPETASRVNAALQEGRRVVAVGTTVTRSLEDQMARFGALRPGSYETDLFITPGYRFRAVSGLVTNFHLPGSTLVMLVSALAGRERVLAAYREAVDGGYRFYSYGDAMMVWGQGTVPRDEG